MISSIRSRDGRSHGGLLASVLVLSLLGVGAWAQPATATSEAPAAATTAASVPAADVSTTATPASTAAAPASTAPAAAPHFDHKAHLERGASCTDCHDLSKGTKGMRPTMANCASCHEVDTAKIGPGCAQCHVMKDESPEDWKWALPESKPGVVFDHKLHVEGKKLECKTCHAGIENSEKLSLAVRPSMDLCISCHRKQGKAATRCTVCHDDQLKKVTPESHEQGAWHDQHGHQVRKGHAKPSKQECTFCHQQSFCTTCHQDEMPRDHTNQFRTRGHALLGGLNRDRCQTCHQQDFCIRCHQTSPPATGAIAHRAGWGWPTNRHCFTCHFQQDTCTACHKGQPSHLGAPVPPPTVPAHRASFGTVDCRSCHRGATAAPHVDPGISCESCHRRS